MAQRGIYLVAVVVAFSAAPEAPQAAQDEVTYAETVAPILLDHCVQCHRPGGLGPFSLLDYESARDRAALIASVTRRGEMPPWKPSAPTGVFQGERRLTSAQIESIARWAAAGAPEGKAPVRPIPLNTADGGWQLGTPDLIVRLPEPYVVPAGTSDLYRKFVLPVPLDEPSGSVPSRSGPVRAARFTTRGS